MNDVALVTKMWYAGQMAVGELGHRFVAGGSSGLYNTPNPYVCKRCGWHRTEHHDPSLKWVRAAVEVMRSLRSGV